MTNEDIERFIDALNAKAMLDRIFRMALSDRVESAKVWVDYPQGRAFNESSYDFFFIKDGEGKYIAAVLDMRHDLHVFVKEAHRKNGHLASAMKSVILPKLQQDGRQVQTVTFQDQAIGSYCEKQWGFSITGPTSAELDLTMFANHPVISPKAIPPTHEEFSSIEVKSRRAKLYVQMLKEQVEAAYGDSNGLLLEDLLDEISNLSETISSFAMRK